MNQFEKEKAETPLEEWMLYLRDGYISPDTKAPGLQKARERLRVLSMPDKERWAYEEYLYNKHYEEDIVETAREDGWVEGYDQGETAGREEGRIEGRDNTILEIVQRMKAEGMAPADILRLTSYSETP